jgi:hypothetical protein
MPLKSSQYENYDKMFFNGMKSKQDFIPLKNNKKGAHFIAPPYSCLLCKDYFFAAFAFMAA